MVTAEITKKRLNKKIISKIFAKKLEEVVNIDKALKNIPFLKITPIVIAGILCGHTFGVEFAFWALMLLIVTLIGGLFAPRALIYPALFLFGSSLIWLNNPNEIPVNRDSNGIFVVQEKIKTDYICSIVEVDSIMSNSKIMLIDSKKVGLNIESGDTIIVTCNIEHMKEGRLLNKKKHISNDVDYFAKIYENDYILKHGVAVQQEKSILKKIKKHIYNNIKQLSCSNDSKAILLAMILGDKGNLSYEWTEKFRVCGISHLLAISGWHIGIIFLFLNIILFPIGRIKYGQYVKSIIIILVIWLYAAMVGYTPSVCRAALMFSMLQYALYSTISRNMRYNIIFGSFFMFVCYDYNYLFDVGFQLSYTAIISIQIFFNRINDWFRKLLRKNNFATKWLTSSLAIIISAQILTTPITLYYFGMYSTISILPNLILSALFPIIIILVLIFCIYPNIVIDKVIYYLLETIEGVINYFAIDNVLIRGLYITPLEMVIYYIVILILLFTVEKD